MRWVLRWRLWAVLSFLSAAAAGYFLWPWGLFLTLLLGLFGVWCTAVALHRGRIVGEGSEGEALVAKVLESLPLNARVLHSVQFKSGDRIREVDHILITPYALFCIETKYLRGKISGGAEEREWTLHKRARKTRSRYKRTFYNPLKQVATQIYHVRHYLEMHLPKRWAEECSRIWIQGVVVFAHPQGDASQVTDAKLGVLSLDQLGDYLKNYQPPPRAHRLSYGLRREIAKALGGKP